MTSVVRMVGLNSITNLGAQVPVADLPAQLCALARIASMFAAKMGLIILMIRSCVSKSMVPDHCWLGACHGACLG